MLKDKVLPDGFMDEKLLLVPKFSLTKVTHLGLGYCPSFSGSTKQETVDYLRELDDDFEGSRSLFKSMSFNEFFANEEKFCKKCSSYVKINVPLDGSLPLRAWEVINFVTFCTNRLTSDLTADWYTDLCIVIPEHEGIEAIFENFTSLKEFRMKVKDRLFSDRVPSLQNFREKLVEFVTDFSFSKFNFTENGVVNKLSSTFMVSLKEELLTSADLVIFDSTELVFSYRTILKLEGFQRDFAEKILFSPALTISKFAVLPYLEFEALKIIVEFNNVNAYSQYDRISLERNVAVSQDTNLVELCETMKQLFDENNVTMRNYATLYDVAVNV